MADDELQQLAAADPAAHADAADARSPSAVALFERITMSDTQSTSRRRLPLVLGAAAALLVVLLGVVVVSRGGGDAAVETADPAPTTVDTSAPISPGGPSSGSCVETYDLTTLANREVAFAGTVEAIDGDDITFGVERWYRGGDGATVTLAGASTLTGITSAGGPVIAVGDRVLVAGDGGFAWSCGFTQPYDDAVAAQWSDALAGG